MAHGDVRCSQGQARECASRTWSTQSAWHTVGAAGWTKDRALAFPALGRWQAGPAVLGGGGGVTAETRMNK